MRKKVVAGNWKMNNTLDEGLELASEVMSLVDSKITNGVTVVLGTPFIHLSEVAKLSQEHKDVHVAAQDCSQHGSGAYTGEVSVEMIKSTGADHVIIGHSERREYHHESNSELASKLDMALNTGLNPIFCCGEPLEVRESDNQESFVRKQLSESLFHLSQEEISQVAIAYEPIWAIGTGKTATSEQAQEMHQAIRNHLSTKYGTAANDIPILYGGSCKPSNAKELFEQPDIDGGLIGGASLNAKDFIAIINSF